MTSLARGLARACARLGVSAAAAAALLPGGPAAGQELRGFVAADQEVIDLRPSRATADFVPFELETREVAVMLEGEFGRARLRVRTAASGAVDKWPDNLTVRLKEASYDLGRVRDWSLSVGVQQRSWDSGFLYQPLGFFRSSPRLGDPFDREGKVGGVPMLSALRVGDEVSTEVVVAYGETQPSARFPRSSGAVAVRVSGELARGLSNALVVRANRDGVGVGVSASYVLGDVEAHADVFVAPAAASLRHGGVDAPAPRLFVLSPYELHTDPTLRVSSVAGLGWTPTSRINLNAEWSHRGDGLSRGEWRRFLAMVDAHRAAVRSPQSALALTNLAWDRRLLNGSARRDYLGVSGRLDLSPVDVTASWQVGLADGGSSSYVSVGWLGPARIYAALSLVLLRGDDDSEFGLSSASQIATLRLSRGF